MDRLVTPPGWPAQVRPPDAPGWDLSATAWLLDLCPPEFRGYPSLRRHVVVLARFAAIHVQTCSSAAQTGLGELRTSMRDYLEPEAVEAAVATWERELARLAGVRRSVALVEEALRGRRFRARL